MNRQRLYITPLAMHDGRSFLSVEERKAAATFPTEQRRREWIAGRLVAKNSIRNQLVTQRSSDLIPLHAIEVYHGINREPCWRFSPHEVFEISPEPNVTVSIAHNYYAAIAASQWHSMIGVDIEDATRTVSHAFLKYFLTTDEVADIRSSVCGDKQAITYWTLKEAAMKAIKTGLSTSSKQICVIDPDLIQNRAKLILSNNTRQYILYGLWMTFNGQRISIVSSSPIERVDIIQINIHE